MKKKALIILIVSVVAALAVLGVFFGRDNSKMEKLFNDTIASLDSEQGLKELFNDYAVDAVPNLDEEINALNAFYHGKSVEIMKPKIYHESSNIYRMYATIVTDTGDKYFLDIAAAGARIVDNYGINQLIIEDSKEFESKKIFKKDQFAKYNEHAAEYGVTIRVKGD